MSLMTRDIIFSILIVYSIKVWSLSPHANHLTSANKVNQDYLFEFILPGTTEKNDKVKMIPYDATLYEFAYKAYLQTKNIKNAYTLSASAVVQRPNSIIWRKRLAQVAIWKQEPSVALTQYFFLAKYFKDKITLEKGLNLARSMHEGEKFAELQLLYLQNGHFSEKNWQDYIDIMLRLGNIIKLLSVLDTYQHQMSKKFYLNTLAMIYRINDNPVAELKSLNQLTTNTEITPLAAQQLSSLYLNQGKIAEADRVMNQARKQAKSNDYAFWDTYAKVSYLSNKSKNELYAYQKLLKQKKPDASIYTRLSEITTHSNAELAYTYASEGKKLYHNDYSLANYVFALMNNKNQSINFPKILASTPESVRKLLKYDNVFWNAQALYWKAIGDDEQTIQAYLTGINYSPAYDNLKSNLIYFLIETNDLERLRKIVPIWQQSIPTTPGLWGAYSKAYSVLNDPIKTKSILSLFYDQLPNYRKNPQWLISFKDALENSEPTKAKDIAHYAWPIYLNYLRQQTDPPDYEQTLDYVKLSIQEASGDSTLTALYLLQDHPNDDVESLMLSWALKHSYFSLARATYWHYNSLGMEAPPWAKLSIALERHEKTLERKIILNRKSPIPYRDRIQAAIDIEAIPHAQTLAFNELGKNRHDNELYDNSFTQVMLRTARHLDLNQEYYQYGNAVGPRTKVSYTYFLTPGISLTPHNSIWFISNIPGGKVTSGNDLSDGSNQVLATVPPQDERAGVSIHTQQKRGTLDFDLGYRGNLTSFFTAKLAADYLMFYDLNASAVLGYHQPADDTTGLLVGGMKNNIAFEFAYNALIKDTLFANYSQNSYFTQDGQYVSQGGQTTLRYEHKLWKNYPDWAISPYGVATQYYAKTKGLLHGSILKLVPKGVIPNVNFLIPADSIEYGLTLSVGQASIDDYTYRWRPFGAFTLSQNSVVGLGELFNIGAAGTVFGRDHLLFYYEWGSNQGQGLQTSRLIKMSYKIYS